MDAGKTLRFEPFHHARYTLRPEGAREDHVKFATPTMSCNNGHIEPQFFDLFFYRLRAILLLVPADPKIP